MSSASPPASNCLTSCVRRDCCTTVDASDSPITDPAERKRYEQAVTIARSSGDAFAIRSINVVVTPTASKVSY